MEFLERSCTAEFSGFLLYKELGRRLKTTNPVVAEVGTKSNAGKEGCNKSVQLGKAATEVSRYEKVGRRRLGGPLGASSAFHLRAQSEPSL